ncbi:PAS domain-containing sensor histidine kinase [Phycisphaera mikurensis]|uniref:Putative two-component system sensor histidine kinase n=1 Tax=Phycisphaera mikurensis (strain NBRC 102666 / KCTC 22515 / FYK2301M01) TaxID=1142394 RepID=I0IGI5_PHYMF|nr:PAS domain-containing protein [Phycisphaera mikurensis]MBB6442946.1 PAS domain S-box-containing protein [Phycisphaera mikurensis]BAM04373.1 putative two-component system sensor histidine kinase [Phycisphaera mikurensis NBRC 102666]
MDSSPPTPPEPAEPADTVEGLRARLRRSEDRFHAAAGGMLDAFYLLDAVRDAEGTIIDFRFTELNENGADIIGRRRADVIGQRLCELLPINRERGYFELYARVVESGEPMLREDSFAEADGIHASWLQFQAVKVGDGVAIHTKNITQRKRQEHETQRLYNELRMIFNAVPALIFFKDCHNNVLRVNQAVADLMGMPLDRIEGRSTEELFPEEAASYYADDMDVLKSGVAKLGYVEKQTLPSGKRIWLRTDKSPLYDADGEPLGVLAVVTDITEQRQSALQAAVLEKAVEERQAMGRNLHDGIGQQFTGVRMLIEKVRRQVKRGEVPKLSALDEIAEVVASASTEVRRMISGLTPERIAVEELPVALGQVASNVQNFYGVPATSRCMPVVGVLQEEAANHFLAMAQEAAINAARHADAELIEIELLVDDAALVLSVTDDGCGTSCEGSGMLDSESTGRGMQILGYRASEVGGRLEIGRPGSSGSPLPTGSGRGTCVRVTVPR